MLTPNQIKGYPLVQVKQGLYKASDVEAFRQKIYVSYAELASANTQLKEKFSSLSGLVNEYNASKNSIASAIISAQTYANSTKSDADEKAKKTIEQANEKAEEILNRKKAEADEYYSKKKEQADAFFKDADSTHERVMSEIKEKSDEFIKSVNAQAQEIIKNANEQAAKIVACAYEDAKKARETSDQIIHDANKNLPQIKTNVDFFRAQVNSLIASLQKTVDSIDIPEKIAIDFAPLVEEAQKEQEEAEKFTYEVFPEPKNDEPLPEPEQEEAEQAISDEPLSETEEENLPEDENEAQEAFELQDEQDELPADNLTDEDEPKQGKPSNGTDYIFDRFSSFSDMFSSSDHEKSNRSGSIFTSPDIKD